jgi:hypothetical protein
MLRPALRKSARRQVPPPRPPHRHAAPHLYLQQQTPHPRRPHRHHAYRCRESSPPRRHAIPTRTRQPLPLACNTAPTVQPVGGHLPMGPNAQSNQRTQHPREKLRSKVLTPRARLMSMQPNLALGLHPPPMHTRRTSHRHTDRRKASLPLQPSLLPLSHRRALQPPLPHTRRLPRRYTNWSGELSPPHLTSNHRRTVSRTKESWAVPSDGQSAATSTRHNHLVPCGPR